MNYAATHLTEDDLDDFLIGSVSPAASAHLAECEACEARLAAVRTEFGSQMAVFSHASLAWSEARSNTIDRNLSAHRTPPRVTMTAIWSTACTLLLAVTFGVTAELQRRSATVETANASTPVEVRAVSQDEIASDNAMLAAIDSEMHAPRPAEFGLYENTDATAQPAHPTAVPQVRD